MVKLYVEDIFTGYHGHVGYTIRDAYYAHASEYGRAIEVEDAWWERYKELAREFNSMQREAARLAGFEEDE